MTWFAFQPRPLGIALLCFLLAIAASTLLTSCQMKELTELHDTTIGPHGLFPDPAKCGECHVEIYEEWRDSPHAKAFVNDRFRRATDDYRFEECLGCHAPQPWLTSEKPAVRHSERDLGIVCVSCHLENGAMVGPQQPTGLLRPHPIVVKPELFENGELCGRCHDGTLAQWQASSVAGKQNCNECHMPEVHRTMTQATGLLSRPIVAMETAGPEHRHSFDIVTRGTPEKFLDLQGTLVEDRLEIVLLNKLPHALPTGDFGVRVIRISATVTHSDGVISTAGRWEVSGTTGQSIPSGEQRYWSADLPSDARSILIEVVRVGRESTDTTSLLRKEVVVK